VTGEKVTTALLHHLLPRQLICFKFDELEVVNDGVNRNVWALWEEDIAVPGIALLFKAMTGYMCTICGLSQISERAGLQNQLVCIS